MYCTACGHAVKPGHAFCAGCGLAVEQDGDPAALEKLVEKKAREILAAERAREQRERERAEAQQAEERALLGADEARRKLAGARAEIARIRATRYPLWRPSWGMLLASFVLALVVGLPASCIAEGVTERPAWGSTLCPSVCSGCTGPGRVVSWTSTVNGSASDHARAFCNSSRYDVAKLDFAQVVSGGYPEVELSWWWRTPLTLLALVVVGFFALPLVLARVARRTDEQRAKLLEGTIRALEREIPEEPRGPGPYR